MKLRLLALIVSVAVSINAFADKPVQQEVISSLRAVFPGLDVTDVKQSRISGLYEVMLGAEVIYASADARYILQGDLIDLKLKRNLTEEQRSRARVNILRDIPADEIIEFSPNNVENSVYVFTDVSCGYCRRLHQDVPELNKHGISVKYLAFPRQGVNSRNFKDMESVWCARDRNGALTDAKFGRDVKKVQCDNPVAKHYELGQAMGVRGTPAIYLESGIQVGGYLPPAELVKALNQ